MQTGTLLDREWCCIFVPDGRIENRIESEAKNILAAGSGMSKEDFKEGPYAGGNKISQHIDQR